MTFDKMLKRRNELGTYVTWKNAQEVWDWRTAPPVKKPKETENNE